MIARHWHGKTRREHGDTYFDYLKKTGVRDLGATPGNQGVWVWRRIDGAEAEFVIVSLWSSFDAIRTFAGDDPEKAVYYPEDKKFLLELEPHVTHYEVLDGPED